MVEEVLNLTQDTDPPRKRNCPSCESVGTVEKNYDNIYLNTNLGLKLTIPAHICKSCDTVVYEPNDYAMILEAEEAAQGRPYIKVEIRHGKINKYSMH